MKKGWDSVEWREIGSIVYWSRCEGYIYLLVSVNAAMEACY